MTSPENVLVHEIIGLGARIVESTDPTLQGVQGSIVFETRNMISIRTTSSSIKQIPKKKILKVSKIRNLPSTCLIKSKKNFKKNKKSVSIPIF